MTSIYVQLKEALEKDIKEGRYQPGDMLPSETELIKAWSVSRVTVRNAIKQLVIEGLVYTIHGRGTFVSENKITNYLPALTSLSRDILERGLVPKNRVLLLEHGVADNQIATQLHLSPGDPVINFVRLSSADNCPIAIAYTSVALAAIAPHQNRISKQALEDGSFYSLLGSIGIPLVGGVQTISAAGANSYEADQLQIEIGSPLVQSLRVAYTRNQVHVEFTKMLARPDMIQWKVHLGPIN